MNNCSLLLFYVHRQSRGNTHCFASVPLCCVCFHVMRRWHKKDELNHAQIWYNRLVISHQAKNIVRWFWMFVQIQISQYIRSTKLYNLGHVNPRSAHSIVALLFKWTFCTGCQEASNSSLDSSWGDFNLHCLVCLGTRRVQSLRYIDKDHRGLGSKFTKIDICWFL